MKPWMLYGLAGAAIVAAGAVAIVAIQREPEPDIVAVADFGGPFTLQDETGATIDEAAWLGKPTAIFFGYTYCPDICPSTLGILSALIDDLGSDADRFNFAFVSVDWERDTPEDMAAYVSRFNDHIRGYAGTEAQIDGITAAYHVFVERVPGTNADDYLVNHTSTVFLMDAEGHLGSTLRVGEDYAIALDKLRLMLGRG